MMCNSPAPAAPDIEGCIGRVPSDKEDDRHWQSAKGGKPDRPDAR